MSRSEVWVQLGDEFGGQRFGPFSGAEFRIGTADDNHIKVADGLGVEPQHVRILRRGNDSFLLAPVERGATIWLYRAGQRQPVAVQGPTVIVTGDSFALASPHGVRFHLVHEEQKRPTRGGANAAASAGSNMASQYKNALGQEVLRRVRSGVLTTWFGRFVQNTWTFVRGGQMFSPVYIIGFLTMMSGWGVSWRSCNQNKTLTSQKVAAEAAHQECVNDRGQEGAEGASSVGLATLASRILGERTWETSLDWPPMRDAIVAELQKIFGRQEDLFPEWYTGQKSRFAVVEGALEQAKLPPELSRLLAWSAVDVFAGPEVGAWTPREGKEGQGKKEYLASTPGSTPETQACQRGLFRLTYRQAIGLDLKAAEDALFTAAEASQLTGGGGLDYNLVQIRSAFNETRLNAGLQHVDAESIIINDDTFEQVFVEAGTCLLRVDVPDDRIMATTAAAKIADRLALTGSDLPAKGNSNWLSGRLATLYALDLVRGQVKNVDVTTKPLATAFTNVEDPEGVLLVARRTGTTIARAMAIPCLMILKEGAPSFPEKLGPPPTFDDCALLKARSDYNKLN